MATWILRVIFILTVCCILSKGGYYSNLCSNMKCPSGSVCILVKASDCHTLPACPPVAICAGSKNNERNRRQILKRVKRCGRPCSTHLDCPPGLKCAPAGACGRMCRSMDLLV